MSWLAEEHDPEWPFELIATDFRLDPAATGLLVVDMQGSDGTISPPRTLRPTTGASARRGRPFCPSRRSR